MSSDAKTRTDQAFGEVMIKRKSADSGRYSTLTAVTVLSKCRYSVTKSHWWNWGLTLQDGCLFVEIRVSYSKVHTLKGVLLSWTNFIACSKTICVLVLILLWGLCDHRCQRFWRTCCLCLQGGSKADERSCIHGYWSNKTAGLDTTARLPWFWRINILLPVTQQRYKRVN
jgi:hypothetical protein